jgi:NTP pyrophosphatase (non-canonical NTP hydrolase)
MFHPTNSNYHDDRCCCPVCSGLCQDDYEYYSGTGQYASEGGLNGGFKMTISEYQEAVKRTCATEGADVLKLALIGVSGELGEIAEPVKKHLWGGHELDRNHLQEEIGDLCWYLATLCNGLGVSLSDAMQENIEKLLRRYPDGFSVERSINRALK